MQERDIIIELLNAKLLFCNYMRYMCWGNDDVDGQTLVMFVNINELFYPGADAETILNKEDLFELYDLWTKHSYMGVDIWAIKKRKEQPMLSNKKALIDSNLWLPEFDSYKENEFDI